ncbi:tRNA lysidine(34) synthetase TilS [Komagataeibacter rhaeticus]|mgnify:CR=1 FL=1|uniref:tRNA lysidine(34) synthetase TilS n=1 Tax=Komagataeibacter rhaeticus TaxID=215221 RepID=UPI0004D74601|nr:tRNA lysidine(34) synthetase TilS [Komagataeibacter rhaeticus]KDU96855.1 tRNA(Ile)-lysidine synthetase [Komagataeibacter rhaeticus AF1]MBL7240596.1 tRNA lysidine(34) synthetase TilS [Komagataeibacter rhaeticus]PYD53829.1 tRNA lysidine(34) synthetase TilS [Komagataeibacter rhaeticus]GBQ10131.1 Ile-tRNA lysidine synthase [Komagataeibacter rhaeticus DSM 16663]
MPGQPHGPAEPLGLRQFAPVMAALGPWPGHGVPVAVAVSGGADSMALAVLARQWRPDVVGLVVDHGLRAESRREAEQTIGRLSALGLSARLLVLEGLERGPRMAERARRMRYAALSSACREIGALDLLVAHHAGDQAETVMMRQHAASGDDGLAGMALVTPMHDVRLVRPLLSFAKPALYATVRAAGLAWVEDPSNADLRTGRARARQALAQDAGQDAALKAQALQAGQARMERDRADACWLASHARFHPGGWVVLPAGLAPPRILSGLVRVVGGHDYPPDRTRINLLAQAPQPATLAGVAIMPWRDGQWLVAREEAAMAPRMPARTECVWDRRFVLRAGSLPPDCAMGAAGAVASWWPAGRGRPVWPARVLRTLPALWHGGRVVAVPHMGVCTQGGMADAVFVNHPPQPVLPGARFGGGTGNAV